MQRRVRPGTGAYALLVIGTLLTVAVKANDSELADFEFDGKDGDGDDYYYVNEGDDQIMQPSHKIMSYAKPPQDGTATGDDPLLMEDDDTSFEVMDDVEFVDHGADFQRKTAAMKRIMLKAFANREFQRKFGEVLPLLKVMSRTQKSTLAALITAQVNSRDGHTLTLQQVKAMFGNRPELILPLIYDIANLIRTVAKKESLLVHQQPSAGLTANDALEEDDQAVLSNHLLRRSFDVRQPAPQGFRSKEIRSVDSNLRDDRLVVDVPSSESMARSSDMPVFERLVQPLPRFNVQRTAPGTKDDRMSYHERKLNMTAFNATGAQRDQLAMPSDGPIPVTLPKVSPYPAVPVAAPVTTTSTVAPGPSLTREEIEDLAFGGLNGTEADAINVARAALGNATDGQPVAEMLIAERNRHGIHALLPSEQCEYFSGGVCIRVEHYPRSEIMYSINRHKHAIGALLAEHIDKSTANDRTEYEPDEIEQGLNTRLRKREDDPSKSGGGMCPSIIRYARPQKARSATGEWKYIVNTGEHTQTLRLEKCSTPQDSCTYLTDNFRSRCVQIYNYHRLLSWDSTRGLHVDIFKVPTCCSCHIDGYRETFPPVTSYSDYRAKIQDDHAEAASTVVRNTQHYTTLKLDQDDEPEDEGSIAYQFSNGFQRMKPPKFDNAVGHHTPAGPAPVKIRYERPKHGIIKPKLPHFVPPPTLDTYLSPPPNDLAFHVPFKRGPHFTDSNTLKRAGNVGNGGNRRPLRKNVNIHDQSIAETDSRINQVAVLPPPPAPEKHRKRYTTLPPSPSPSAKDKTGGFRVGPYQPAGPTVDIIPTVMVTLPQVPSTASTSTTAVTSTNGHQRINYSYHPIIDFFEEEQDAPDATQEQIDRIGLNSHTSLNSWKPVLPGRPRYHP